MVSLGSFFEKDLASSTVLSSDLPSTMITSKSLKVCLLRSSRSLGRYLASLRAGIMTEKNGFWVIAVRIILCQ